MAGSTIRADAAIEIIGVSASAATSTIASEFGVIVEPTITSTLSSVISLRVLVTALVVSDASSSTIQLIFSPPIVVGSSSNVFFSRNAERRGGTGRRQRHADVDVGQRRRSRARAHTAAASADNDIRALHASSSGRDGGRDRGGASCGASSASEPSILANAPEPVKSALRLTAAAQKRHALAEPARGAAWQSYGRAVGRVAVVDCGERGRVVVQPVDGRVSAGQASLHRAARMRKADRPFVRSTTEFAARRPAHSAAARPCRNANWADAGRADRTGRRRRVGGRAAATRGNRVAGARPTRRRTRPRRAPRLSAGKRRQEVVAERRRCKYSIASTRSAASAREAVDLAASRSRPNRPRRRSSSPNVRDLVPSLQDRPRSCQRAVAVARRRPDAARCNSRAYT